MIIRSLLKKLVHGSQEKNIDFDKTENILPTDLKDDSPEKAIIEFINLWQKNNYGYMANYIHYFSPQKKSTSIIRMREMFQNKRLLSYKIVNIEDKAPVITHVTLNLTIEFNKKIYEKEVDFRITYEGHNVVHGDKGGQWKIVKGYSDLEFL